MPGLEINLTAGELRHRVAIERRSAAKDSFGDRADAWDPVTTRWASVEPVSNRTIELARGFASTVDYECRLRYCEEITTDCRVRLGDKTFHVNGVIHDVRRRRWTLGFLTAEGT